MWRCDSVGEHKQSTAAEPTANVTISTESPAEHAGRNKGILEQRDVIQALFSRRQLNEGRRVTLMCSMFGAGGAGPEIKWLLQQLQLAFTHVTKWMAEL